MIKYKPTAVHAFLQRFAAFQPSVVAIYYYQKRVKTSRSKKGTHEKNGKKAVK